MLPMVCLLYSYQSVTHVKNPQIYICRINKLTMAFCLVLIFSSIPAFLKIYSLLWNRLAGETVALIWHKCGQFSQY